MTSITDNASRLLDAIADLLDIPKSYYEKAADRYRSLGDWFHRDGSKVAAFEPEVYSQGSFRYGTVNRPLLNTEEYDLDSVCELRLAKATVTQRELKDLLGDELKAYAERYGIHDPVVERNRCWRLDYADAVYFHIDALPCVPEDPEIIREICARGVPPHLAATSVAITDRRHPRYTQITRAWPCSNPRGLGSWFEGQAKPAARARMKHLVENRAYASLDQVPPYEWKTPLQRAIQIMKRHRDVHYKDDSEFAPISMIITVLAARAYRGEPNLYDALVGIVDRMPGFVADARPRIPNPVNPAEDFADRWASDARFEDNFWAWHAAIKTDIAKLPDLLGKPQLAREVNRLFGVDLTQEQLERLQPNQKTAIAAVVKAAPVIHIAAAPKPWRNNA
jgi:hypothetical protein